MDNNDKDIRNVITDIFKSEKRLSKGYNQYSIEQIWRDNFGSLISGYTSRVTFSKGILTVYITSSPLKNEITLNKENIIARLNTILKYNKVKDLYVR